MSKLRLLATSALASAFVLTAAAQSPSTWNPAPLAAAITSPSILTLNATSAPSTPPLFTQPGSYTFKPSTDAAAVHITVGKSLKISKEEEQRLVLNSQKRIGHDTLLLARTQSACATLRSYNFTKRDLKSANPTPSSETDCTPLSKAHLLELPATSAKSPAAISIQAPATPK